MDAKLTTAELVKVHFMCQPDWAKMRRCLATPSGHVCGWFWTRSTFEQADGLRQRGFPNMSGPLSIS